MTELAPCVFCHSVQFRTLHKSYCFDDAKIPFDVVECLDCHLTLTSPQPGEQELGKYYSMGYYGSNSKKFAGPVEQLVRWANRSRAQELIQKLGPVQSRPARVLDIGCGRGNFLKAMRDFGFDCFGVEIPSFDFPDYGPGIHFLHGSVEAQKFETGSFDAVSIWHVLEHTRNPVSTLREITRVLKPGGVAAIAVPNFGSIQAAIFGKHWFHLDLPRHLYHLDRPWISRVLTESGMKVELVKTNSPDQNFFGFIQSTLNALFSDGNSFYGLIKHKPSSKGAVRRVFDWAFYSALCVVLVPFSLIENWISTTLGRGATLIIYARKSGN